MRLIMMGCPIRKPPDQRLFAPPRSFSQLIASFIASMCLGILHTLLVALPKALDQLNDQYFLSNDKKYFHFFIISVSQNEVTAFRRLQKTIHIVNRHQFPIFKEQKILWS